MLQGKKKVQPDRDPLPFAYLVDIVPTELPDSNTSFTNFMWLSSNLDMHIIPDLS